MKGELLVHFRPSLFGPVEGHVEEGALFVGHGGLRAAEYGSECGSVAGEVSACGLQVGAAGGADLVVAGAPVLVGESPVGGDEVTLLHAVEGEVECAFV